MPKTIRTVPLLFYLLITTFAQPANACSCLPPAPPQTALEQSTAVFSGKVISLEPKQGVLRVTFEVYDVWKGIPSRKLSITTADNSAACGINFEVGQEYLVYASSNGDRQLSTNLCSRTKSLSAAQEDLQALGKPDKTKKGR